jgi:hypothetical protein
LAQEGSCHADCALTAITPLQMPATGRAQRRRTRTMR